LSSGDLSTYSLSISVSICFLISLGVALNLAWSCFETCAIKALCSILLRALRVRTISASNTFALETVRKLSDKFLQTSDRIYLSCTIDDVVAFLCCAFSRFVSLLKSILLSLDLKPEFQVIRSRRILASLELAGAPVDDVEDTGTSVAGSDAEEAVSSEVDDFAPFTAASAGILRNIPDFNSGCTCLRTSTSGTASLISSSPIVSTSASLKRRAMMAWCVVKCNW
jgi:hypothetical protein